MMLWELKLELLKSNRRNTIKKLNMVNLRALTCKPRGPLVPTKPTGP